MAVRFTPWSLMSRRVRHLFNEFWDSPLAVYSETTDVVFEIKHRFQSEGFGKEEEQLWRVEHMLFELYS